MAAEKTPVSAFFSFMAARHAIWQARQDGKPWPWTDDPILQKFKFCNVFRELDRTTEWYRVNVRQSPKHQNPHELVIATIIFRSFNFIPTGEILLKHELFWKWDPDVALDALKSQRQVVTGAYIIRTPDGMNKLHGVIANINEYWPYRRELGDICENPASNLERAWRWFQALYNVGPFTAYEFVTDIRHTPLLDHANDTCSWAYAGPGAVRGVNRLLGINVNISKGPDVYLANMQKLLTIAPKYLPADFPALEMREIEHTLCEFDKYERVRLGEGPMKAKYTPPHARTERSMEQVAQDLDEQDLLILED